ncbi:DUF5610 domain-containing protein [Marichromatium bheemlicum]|uniref:DUF5610 domain-containing protein n=1 Tax=Marichromatium bheemlicum TaxID=365339 RepID=A0ABX1I8L6_9GAMM|nr:DUF5610 domain-containing protein [Marichromatium bheemlicum]NKN33116.1 DUF5610 domain-containing protein [Marichromatium bheemlicum]
MISLHSSVSQLQSLSTLRSGAGASGSPTTATRDATAAAPQQQVLERLAAHIPGMDANAVRKLDAEEFTPDKVANRIADAVATGLESARARGRSEAEIEQLYQQAVEGARQGFKEAREILSNLDALQGKVADQLDETEQLTFAALDGLAPGGQGTASSATTAIGVAERFQHAESFSLEVRTRDGDSVRIDFGQQLDYSASAALARDSEGNQVAQFDVSRTASSNYSFSVKGDLDADELDAIRNLVQDTSELANSFFQGDVQAAFSQAGSLSFDASQLSRMELNMSSSTSYSAAQAQRYQETQQLGNESQSERPGRRIGQLMDQMQERFSQPALGFLEDARASGAELMQGLVEQDERFVSAEKQQQDDLRSHMSRLLDAFAPQRTSGDD